LPEPIDITRAHGSIILVRHGWTAFAVVPYYVPPGPPLSQNGIDRMRWFAKRFEGVAIERHVASPFIRTMETARILFREAKIEESAAWSEIAPGESVSSVRIRVQEWLQQNIPRAGETVAVVSHGAPLNAAIEALSPSFAGKVQRNYYGNIMEQGEAWVLRWERGMETYCGPFAGEARR
jgi:broad specificity phosphatase PhoE